MNLFLLHEGEVNHLLDDNQFVMEGAYLKRVYAFSLVMDRISIYGMIPGLIFTHLDHQGRILMLF